MMNFGFSGRQSLQEGEIITRSNHIRASILADLVETRRVAIRQTYRGRGGRTETICYPNPAFQCAITAGYTYDRDWLATLEAFRARLDADGGLCSLAECQGVTVEGVEYEIEQIRESVALRDREAMGRPKKRRCFDA